MWQSSKMLLCVGPSPPVGRFCRSASSPAAWLHRRCGWAWPPRFPAPAPACAVAPSPGSAVQLGPLLHPWLLPRLPSRGPPLRCSADQNRARDLSIKEAGVCDTRVKAEQRCVAKHLGLQGLQQTKKPLKVLGFLTVALETALHSRTIHALPY